MRERNERVSSAIVLPKFRERGLNIQKCSSEFVHEPSK